MVRQGTLTPQSTGSSPVSPGGVQSKLSTHPVIRDSVSRCLLQSTSDNTLKADERSQANRWDVRFSVNLNRPGNIAQ